MLLYGTVELCPFLCYLMSCFRVCKTGKISVKVLYEAFYDFAGRENVNIRDKIFQDGFCGAKTVSLHRKIRRCIVSVGLCRLRVKDEKKKKNMSAFAIYAFVVTGLYIVYMAVAILMDLFGKKGQMKDSAEEFNNSDMSGGEDDSEGGTLVDETPDGYSTRSASDSGDGVSPEEKDDSEDDEHYDDEVDQKEQLVVESPDDEELLNQESQESQAAYESLKAVQEQMDPVSPHYQDEYRSEDFAVLMAQPMSQKSRILRHYVNM